MLFKQSSMAFRLACIYTVSAFSILMICALALYWIFTSRLEKENYRFLVNNIFILNKIIQEKANKSLIEVQEALKEEVILEPGFYHYYVRVLDGHNTTVIETPKMSALVPHERFAGLRPERLGVFPTKYWATYKNKTRKRHFLLIDALVSSPDHRKEGLWTIEIGMDISSERDIIIDYRQGLLIVLLLGTFCSALLGVVVTRKGLKPLRDMTRSTQQITIARLKERLNPASWPQELYTLAIAVNNMLDRIEDGFIRLSQFSGDLAHELRTPITNLMGEAEIALSRPRTNDEYREVLESSTEELGRIALMIENLLFLARAENPRAAVRFSNVAADQIIKEVCDFYGVLAEEKNIKLSYYGEANLKADVLMLRRAVSNLVSNALIHSRPQTEITLSVLPKDMTVIITVEDQGHGIPKEHLPHIFDRFYRVDWARSQNTGGTGLGLAIVKFIMDLHKGKVDIKSEVNRGTRVSLIFPSNYTQSV